MKNNIAKLIESLKSPSSKMTSSGVLSRAAIPAALTVLSILAAGCGDWLGDVRGERTRRPAAAETSVGSCLYEMRIAPPRGATGLTSRGLMCAEGGSVDGAFCEMVGGFKMNRGCTPTYMEKCVRTDGVTLFLKPDDLTKELGEEAQRQAFRDMCGSFKGAVLESKADPVKT